MYKKKYHTSITKATIRQPEVYSVYVTRVFGASRGGSDLPASKFAPPQLEPPAAHICILRSRSAPHLLFDARAPISLKHSQLVTENTTQTHISSRIYVDFDKCTAKLSPPPPE